MAFPKIDVCIVCEAARPEIDNKHILLGFFGITPHARVFIKDFQLPVGLCFVFSGGSGQPGRYDLGLRLTNSSGAVLSNPNTSPDIKGAMMGPGPSTNVFFGFYGLVSGPDVYHIALLVNGLEHYITTINLESMSPVAPFAKQ